MVYVILLLVGILATFGLLLMVYALLGKGPRIQRGLKQVQQHLDQGDWQKSLEILKVIQSQVGSTPASSFADSPRKQAWLEEINKISVKANRMAADEALSTQQFQVALEHFQRVVSIQGKSETEAQERVLETILAEIRRLFAVNEESHETSMAISGLIQEAKKILPDSPEASFWEALCSIREHDLESALSNLLVIHEQVGKNNLDAALYCGGILHRLGRPQEAVRYLAEANRVNSNCYLVPLQLGLALVAGNGDSSIAIRALQRALAPGALPAYLGVPQKLWIDTFPENQSFLRKLALKYPYQCPLFGNDLKVIIRQGQLGLAQAYYHQENYQESADLYLKLIGDSPPTIVLLRGLGLSLARLGKYDQAYKHLRAALDSDEKKDPLTAGYLALCGGLGKPSNSSDKPKNILWAIRLLSRYSMPGNQEWATIYNQVFEEARSNQIPLTEDDQVELCNVLSSVKAIDRLAAAAYSHLAETFPHRFSLLYGWLYCQSATVHSLVGPLDLKLFTLIFQEEKQTQTFFEQQRWDIDAVRHRYLERWSKYNPGRYPDILGPDYSNRGEEFLLHRSNQEELQGKRQAAVETASVLLKLSPQSFKAMDRLACLSYRQGDLIGAVNYLQQWHQLAPRDHWPLVRQAILEQDRGYYGKRHDLIQKAMNLVNGEQQAEVAFLGAGLSLATWIKGWKGEVENEITKVSLEQAQVLLEKCLQQNPGHFQGLWMVAAVYSIRGDQNQLSNIASRFDRPEIKDSQFHFLGAICHLAKNDFQRVQSACQLAALDPLLTAETHYLLGCAHLQNNNPDQAMVEFKKIALNETSSSAQLARAQIGEIHFSRGSYEEAISWWNRVEPQKRVSWKLEDPLQKTVLLAGLRAYSRGRFELAIQRFDEASKTGLKDRRLASLRSLSLMKAGERLLSTRA